MLPRAAKIMPKIKSGHLDRMGMECDAKLCAKSVCRCARRVVLDGDMRLPFLHVLRIQPWHKCRFQRIAYGLKLRHFDCKGHAGAKMTKADHLRRKGRAAFDDLIETPRDLSKVLSGQMVKYSHVGTEKIALRREVHCPQNIERRHIALVNPRGQDQGLTCFQQAKPF